jgi:hypothetical protein
VQALAGDILLEDLHDPVSAYQDFVAALERGPTPSGEALARGGLAAIARVAGRRLAPSGR